MVRKIFKCKFCNKTLKTGGKVPIFITYSLRVKNDYIALCKNCKETKNLSGYHPFLGLD